MCVCMSDAETNRDFSAVLSAGLRTHNYSEHKYPMWQLRPEVDEVDSRLPNKEKKKRKKKPSSIWDRQ